MRHTIFILTMLIWTTTYGQLDKLKGAWISNTQDCMVIKDTINQDDNSNKLCSSIGDQGMLFYLLGDTLSFQQQYYISTTNFEKLIIDRYDLIIVDKTDTSITVKPISALSKKFFDNRTKLQFFKQEFFRDNSIKFEKIIYHTTSCYGNCPTIDIEIGNDRNIYLSGKFNQGFLRSEIDRVQSGQFNGKLNDSLYKELISLIQTCNLKKLKFPEIQGADGAVTTLIIYYNGQRKYLKSMFPPTIADRLIQFLYGINQRMELTRTNENRTLEK